MNSSWRATKNAKYGVGKCVFLLLLAVSGFKASPRAKVLITEDLTLILCSCPFSSPCSEQLSFREKSKGWCTMSDEACGAVCY